MNIYSVNIDILKCKFFNLKFTILTLIVDLSTVVLAKIFSGIEENLYDIT